MKSSKLEIRIYFPSRCIHHVLILGSMTVSSLRKSAVPSDLKCSLIYKGSKLIESKTFDFYGISNKDIIVVSENNSQDEKWLKISTDQTMLRQSLELISNPKYKSEIYRLKDLILNKLEFAKHRRFGSISSLVSTKPSHNSTEYDCNGLGLHKNYFTTIIPNTVNLLPNDQELPIIWNK